MDESEDLPGQIIKVNSQNSGQNNLINITINFHVGKH